MAEQLDMTSKNWLNENTQFIAERFPNCVTETEDGLKVDFELLQQELSGDVVSGSKERYRLEWPGKRQAMVNANLPTTKTLRPVREDSVDFDNTENLYIEGDNLEVLKILQESYLGKIKMIYIDPPYNTGKDFVYKDNFTQESDEYKAESGQTDEYNRRLVSNPDTSGRYHSDWLSMMYPRLKLARNLLTEDGVIYVSIGDTESSNLRQLLDLVFGAKNFAGNIVWQKKYGPSNDAKGISDTHEHIFVYAKNAAEWAPSLLPRNAEQLKAYKNPDNDPRGAWRPSDLSVRTPSDSCYYEITGPDGQVHYPPKSTSWRVSRQKFDEMLSDNRITFGKSGTGRPMQKKFLSEVKDGITPQTWWSREFAGDTKTARYEMKELIPENVFDTPKPSSLMERLIQISNLNYTDIVLDFFAGSSTMAHGVMSTNLKEGKKLSYILVQIPEKVKTNGTADRAGYNTITDIGKERIRRVASKIREETRADIDYGFKVYRVDESNMENVFYQPHEITQRNVDMFAFNIKDDRNSEDLLTQVMLDWGLSLTLKIKTSLIAGKKLFKVAGNSLYACFDDELNEAFAKAVAAEKPLRLVVKDSAFVNDTAKVNVQQLLKQLSPNTELKVL